MHKNAATLLRRGSLIALLVVIVLYALFQGSKVITGPVIEIYTPENGATYNQTLIEIYGRTKNTAYVNLDDRPIFTDKDGYFREKLLLSPGYNIIKLDAQDKFKKYTEKKLEVILKEY